MGATGRETVVAMEVSDGPWGPTGEVAVGALDGVRVINESFGWEREPLIDKSLGQAWERTINMGNITVEGGITGDWRFESLAKMLAVFSGAETVSQPNVGDAPSVYQRKIELVDDVVALSKFLTVLTSKEDKIHVVPTWRPSTLTISGEAGGVLTFELTGMGNNRIDDSSTNTATERDAVTYRTNELRMLFDIGTFRINDQSDIALAVGDVIKPSSFSLEVPIPFEVDRVACGTTEAAEPDYTDIGEVRLTLGFPKFVSTLPDFLSKLDNETIMKGDIQYAGPIINSGETAELPYEWTLDMPHMQVLDAPVNVDDPGKIPTEITFAIMEAGAAPAGMTVTKPYEQTFQNGNSDAAYV